MNSDLSKVQVGDYIFTIFNGWTRITKVVSGLNYPITTESQYLYTIDGKHDIDAKYPSAFTEPPAEFNAEPNPCEFKKGDKVLVRNAENERWHRRYFSHKTKDGEFHGFHGGADEWSSQDFCGGLTCGWKYCKSWEEGE